VVTAKNTPFAEVLTVTLPRVGALLPFLLMVLILGVPAARPDGDARGMTLLRPPLAVAARARGPAGGAVPVLRLGEGRGIPASRSTLMPRNRASLAIFALSFNMLMGQSGPAVVRPRRPVRARRLLHRACANAVEGRQTIWMPAELIPLVGGLRRAGGRRPVLRLAGDRSSARPRSP
jgi:hypothetical protein